MNLDEILQNKEKILEKVTEFGFLENVKIYNGPRDMLYLIVEHGGIGVSKNAQRCAGLKCEITDLLRCQVAIITSSQISKLSQHEFSEKSALLTIREGLQKVFNTENLKDINIDSPDEEYDFHMEDSRDTYEDFKKGGLLQGLLQREEGIKLVEKGVNKLKVR